MELKVKILKFLAGKPIAILNQKTAEKIHVHVSQRILLEKGSKNLISLIDITPELVKPGEIAVSNEIVKALKLKKGDKIEVSLAREPESKIFIRKKLDCKPLDKKEIRSIISDIVSNALTEVEIAFFVSSIYKCGMSGRETENMIKAIVGTGNTLKFKGKVVDKHCIGGIAGNRTTPLVVSICAAGGLIMPKSSSRAITSAAGTADTIEAISNVSLNAKEIKKIVHKTNACLVWGGSLGLSPADDKLIQIEKVLGLDPESQLLASILSKKISVGSKYVLIDIPYGKGAKVTKKEAEKLKRDFEKFGKRFNLKLKAILTDGTKPIGKGIGPLLEIQDILKILERKEDAPKDLEEKSLCLAGEIFDLCGKTKKGKGLELARNILDSKKAYDKFKEIIKSQAGKIPSEKQLERKLGKLRHVIRAPKTGKIKVASNKKINMLGVIAGSPMDNGAGIYLHKNVGDKTQKGDKLITIYSQSRKRMKHAIEFYKKFKPIEY